MGDLIDLLRWVNDEIEKADARERRDDSYIYGIAHVGDEIERRIREMDAAMEAEEKRRRRNEK